MNFLQNQGEENQTQQNVTLCILKTQSDRAFKLFSQQFVMRKHQFLRSKTP